MAIFLRLKLPGGDESAFRLGWNALVKRFREEVTQSSHASKLVGLAIQERIAEDIAAIRETLPKRQRNSPDRPHYQDEVTRELSEALEEAYCSRAQMDADGKDTTEINATILDLRRKIREGGQLKEGHFLLDGRFQLLKTVGQGGFAQVWRAYDRTRREVVAVKVLHGQYTRDKSRRERFFRGGTLGGHSDGINAVAALDARRVVSVSDDKTLRVWDVEIGETIRTLEGHTGAVYAVAALDGRGVVSASRDNTLRVWDVESGETIRMLHGHTAPVSAVAALDARRVVSVSDDKTLRVWDVETGETLHTLKGHTGAVRGVAALDARRVVSASADKTLRIWDIETGDTIRTFEGHARAVFAVAVLVKKLKK